MTAYARSSAIEKISDERETGDWHTNPFDDIFAVAIFPFISKIFHTAEIFVSVKFLICINGWKTEWSSPLKAGGWFSNWNGWTLSAIFALHFCLSMHKRDDEWKKIKLALAFIFNYLNWGIFWYLFPTVLGLENKCNPWAKPLTSFPFWTVNIINPPLNLNGLKINQTWAKLKITKQSRLIKPTKRALNK